MHSPFTALTFPHLLLHRTEFYLYHNVLMYAFLKHGAVFLHDLLQVDLGAAHQDSDQSLLTCAVALSKETFTRELKMDKRYQEHSFFSKVAFGGFDAIFA